MNTATLQTTGPATAADLDAFRQQVDFCVGRGPECGRPGVVCCAGVHLQPAVLNANSQRYFAISVAHALHSAPDCPAVRGQANTVAVSWKNAAHKLCRTCGVRPAALAEVSGEARKVARPIGVVADVAGAWPGRLPGAQLADLRHAVDRLGKAKVAHLAGLRDEALAVAALLLDADRGWTPPAVPDELLAAAAADLVGVEDDPFFRSGRRPRTYADRAAAEVAGADVLTRLWDTWARTVAASGLGIDVRTLVRTGQRRPAHVAAMEELLRAWTTAARGLVAAEGNDQVVVAIPANAGVRTGAQCERLKDLVPLSAMELPGRAQVAVVVPTLVARWLARGNLNFEVIGPWPGDDIGIAALETLTRLAGGNVDLMPDLLPVAVDLAREDHEDPAGCG